MPRPTEASLRDTHVTQEGTAASGAVALLQHPKNPSIEQNNTAASTAHLAAAAATATLTSQTTIPNATNNNTESSTTTTTNTGQSKSNSKAQLASRGEKLTSKIYSGKEDSDDLPFSESAKHPLKPKSKSTLAKLPRKPKSKHKSRPTLTKSC